LFCSRVIHNESTRTPLQTESNNVLGCKQKCRLSDFLY